MRRAGECGLEDTAWGRLTTLDAYLSAWVASLEEPDRVAYGRPPDDAIWVPRVRRTHSVSACVEPSVAPAIRSTTHHVSRFFVRHADRRSSSDGRGVGTRMRACMPRTEGDRSRTAEGGISPSVCASLPALRCLDYFQDSAQIVTIGTISHALLLLLGRHCRRSSARRVDHRRLERPAARFDRRRMVTLPLVRGAKAERARSFTIVTDLRRVLKNNPDISMLEVTRKRRRNSAFRCSGSVSLSPRHACAACASNPTASLELLLSACRTKERDT